MNIQTILTTELGNERIELNKDLFPFLTLRTVARAEFFFEAKTREEIIRVIHIATSHNIPFLILGGGSNIAPTVNLIKGLVIKNSYQRMELVRDQQESVDVLISSGQAMSKVVYDSVENGWEGFEYHKGLPGTMGGAIYMNSKWTKPWSYVGDRLVTATLIDMKGRLKEVDRKYFQFAYDWSILQATHEIFLEGIFSLTKKDRSILKERADFALEYRKKTQPHGVATCGCFFRNISIEDKERLGIVTTSAGYLIDQSGLKNMSIGSFAVSSLHANFIVNTGKREGKPDDLLQLIRTIKDKVRAKFKVELHEEVVII